MDTQHFEKPFIDSIETALSTGKVNKGLGQLLTQFDELDSEQKAFLLDHNRVLESAVDFMNKRFKINIKANPN